MNDAERCVSPGVWVEDDGKPGIAFSGLDRLQLYPVAYYHQVGNEWGDQRDHPNNIAKREASDRTANRFGASNGMDVAEMPHKKKSRK